MSIVSKLKTTRSKNLNPKVLGEISKFGKVFQSVGTMYRLLGTGIEITGKALQTPESTQDLFNAAQDVRNRILDAAISLVERHESDYEDLIQEAKEFEETLEENMTENQPTEQEEE